jgi:hypothetical protein
MGGWIVCIVRGAAGVDDVVQRGEMAVNRCRGDVCSLGDVLEAGGEDPVRVVQFHRRADDLGARLVYGGLAFLSAVASRGHLIKNTFSSINVKQDSEMFS